MRLAIIGDGLLGQTLQDVFGVAPLTHADIDITSDASVAAALAKHRPDVVINTAAYHRLGECEAEPKTAFAVNATGAGRIARLVPTVYISTDYVFWDGGPHTEDMPGRTPPSVYGRSKLAGELETLEQDGIVVRVAGLYGHYRSHKGPSFPQMILSSEDPITLPTDQRFSPTYAPDAAERIIDLAFDPFSIGVYHAANRGSVSWAEFAEHILAVTRHKRHVLPLVAKDTLRPPDSSLKSTRLPALPFWGDALNRWALREGRIATVNPLR